MWVKGQEREFTGKYLFSLITVSPFLGLYLVLREKKKIKKKEIRALKYYKSSLPMAV